MGFWGIEVKPGKTHPYHSDNVQGTLYITQATLGLGSSDEKSILQCSVEHKNPVFLCSLLPDRMESCSLNLEFKNELVGFSVIGKRSIHLSGYFVSDEGDYLRDEYQSDSGEDISESETDTDDSSEYDYDDESVDDEDFIGDDDDDLEMFTSSPVPNSGVVIEEITDDDKAKNGNSESKQLKKKSQSNDNDARKQIVVKRGTGTSVLVSEDEDGFPISSSEKGTATVEAPQSKPDGQNNNKSTDKNKQKKARDGSDDAAGKRRKDEGTDQDGQPERKKKMKKQKEKGEEVKNVVLEEVKMQDSPVGNEHEKRGLQIDINSMPGESTSDKKKEKKKKKKQKNEKMQDVGEAKSKDQSVSVKGDGDKFTLKTEEKQSEAKSSQIRTFSNGLVIEELAMGKPDGKKASPGRKVSVHYIGKLKKNGTIFDSNVGRAPFKFRLGVGQVIKGWDVGVNGMRVGDKRRLTIPPSMGYGHKGAGSQIPPNSWLVFDVELVNVG